MNRLHLLLIRVNNKRVSFTQIKGHLPGREGGSGRNFILGWIILILLIAGAVFFYLRFYYVFSDGTKTGELNTFAKTGYVFKTYEGEMILTGYGAKSSTGGSVQSKNFKFSVASDEVARQLTDLTGQRVTVHFKQYFGALPWRGYEKSIVDSVITSEPVRENAYSLEGEIFL